MAYNGLQVTILFHVFVNLPLKASPFIHNFSHTSSSGCFFATWTIRVHQIPLIMSAFLWTTSEAWQEILVGIRQKSCKCVRKKSRWRQRVIVSIFPDLAFVSTAWLISNAGGQSSKLGFEKNLHNQSWLGSDGVGAGLLIQYHHHHHHCHHHLHGHHLSLS